VRWLAIGAAQSKTALLLLQPLHAVTFGLWFLSLAKRVQDVSPEPLRASFQGVNAASVGLGGLLGYLSGGAMFQATGGTTTFCAAAASALVGAVVYQLTNLRQWSAA
jgi:PPP family 3-phenylpropionic acid transporter